MSVVSSRLSRRVVCVDEPARAREGTGRRAPTLASLAVGESATISGFSSALEPAVARRLFDLGFVPGTKVLAARRAPMHDPVVYRVSGIEVALRQSESCGIELADQGAA